MTMDQSLSKNSVSSLKGKGCFEYSGKKELINIMTLDYLIEQFEESF